jgi:hypothetical protein
MIVQDAAGRDLDVRPISFQEEMTLAAGVGSVNDSATWWRLVKRACAIRSIAGAMVHMPQTRNQIKLLTKRLGPDGLRAIDAALQGWSSEAVEPAALEYQPVDEVELIDLLEIGGGLSDIPTWRGIAWLAAGIRKVGDEVVEFPSDMQALRKLVARMDEPAVRAAFEARTDAEPAAAGKDDEADAAKN